MSFYKDGYFIVKNLITKHNTFEMHDHLNQRSDGNLNDEQINNTPSFYADEMMQEMQTKLLPKIEEHIGLELLKTYTYARVYKRGDILRIHTDREACEISVTLDLGGDPWSIWLLDRDENPVEVKLNPGDALIYRGLELHHWRAKFEGDIHTQVFLHYIDKYGQYIWAENDKRK